MKRYRNEWKFCCSEGELRLLENRLSGILSLDPHIGPQGRYSVHSLYFDDLFNTSAAENEAGIAHRYKYRIRYYDTFSGKLQLERKEKYNGRCAKQSCPLSLEEYHALLCGDVYQIIHQTPFMLLKKFCLAIMTRGFAPKARIDYERIAYVEPITNIRITLDKNISASSDTASFLTGEYRRVPLQPKDCHVLEVKFDDILPSYIQNIIASESFQQTTFSKYYLGRKAIEALGI